MKRHRSRRQNANSKLNLVALMDIFTILVFFLMVNSSDVQIKETHESVALPKSATTELPADTLKLYITTQYMFFDVSSTQIPLDSFQADTGVYPDLVTVLKDLADSKGPLSEEQEAKGLAITIMGDQKTDYTTVQQVLATCAQTPFRDVSLAVIFEDNADETANVADSSDSIARVDTSSNALDQ